MQIFSKNCQYNIWSDFSFDQALDVINEAMEVFKQNARLETFYIPGTNIEIDQYRNNVNNHYFVIFIK